MIMNVEILWTLINIVIEEWRNMEPVELTPQKKINRPEVSLCNISEDKPSPRERPTKKIVFDPRQLIKPFDRVLPLLIEKPEKKKRKATNIPKFIIKVFYRDLPVFPTEHHNERLNKFAGSLNESKTRFHMI